MPQSDNINATATAFISRNKLGTIVLENPGAGYTSAPTVTVTGGGNNVTKTARVVAVLENKKVRTGSDILRPLVDVRHHHQLLTVQLQEHLFDM